MKKTWNEAGHNDTSESSNEKSFCWKPLWTKVKFSCWIFLVKVIKDKSAVSSYC